MRTSILCKRWQNLRASISIIDLEDHADGTDNPMRHASFLNIVERIVVLHDRSDIERLRLSFKTPINPSHAYSWISAASRHNVKELELFLTLRGTLNLPCHLFNCGSLTMLTLHLICSFNPRTIHLPNIKGLHLSQVTFGDESSTQLLFSNCPSLQDLTLIDCGWENIKHITMSIPNLRHLTFQQYPPLPDDKTDEESVDCEMEVHAVNLVELDYMSTLSAFLLIKPAASSLVNASAYMYAYSGPLEEIANRCLRMVAGIQSVRSLIVSDETLECLFGAGNLPSNLPVFPNLVYLKVLSQMTGEMVRVLLDLLWKSPNLEVLEIDEDLVEEDEWNFVPPPYLQSRLKIVQINAMGEVLEAPTNLVKYLLKYSSVLEQLIVSFQDNFELQNVDNVYEFESEIFSHPVASPFLLQVDYLY